MTTAARAEPTEQQLRAAYKQCVARRRSVWPDTFEDAMKDPLLSRLVRITAMHPGRALAIQRQHLPALPSAPAVFDRKRAAAGDRDD